jgi:hypothetical protein
MPRRHGLPSQPTAAAAMAGQPEIQAHNFMRNTAYYCCGHHGHRGPYHTVLNMHRDVHVMARNLGFTARRHGGDIQ